MYYSCCNFDIRKLRIYIPAFCTECIYASSEATSETVNSCYEDVINQIIWNDKKIVIQNESIFDELLFS